MLDGSLAGRWGSAMAIPGSVVVVGNLCNDLCRFMLVAGSGQSATCPRFSDLDTAWEGYFMAGLSSGASEEAALIKCLRLRRRIVPSLVDR